MTGYSGTAPSILVPGPALGTWVVSGELAKAISDHTTPLFEARLRELVACNADPASGYDPMGWWIRLMRSHQASARAMAVNLKGRADDR